MPQSPKAVARDLADPQRSVIARQTFGAGPYVLVPSQTVTNDHCTYVPNKYYYDQSRIKWGKVVTRQINDPNAALAAMRTGQIDVYVFAEGRTANAATAAGMKALHAPTAGLSLEFMDRGGKLVPALADPRVRQALNYAVDRKKISRAFYNGHAPPSSNPNFGSDGEDPKDANYYTYNPAKARALLAAAGYPNGFSFKLICFGAWAGGLNYEGLSQGLAKDFAAVGVKMEVDAPATAAEFDQKFGSGTYSAYILGLITAPTWLWYNIAMIPGYVLGDQHGFRDPVVDKLWLKGQRLPLKKARQVWREFMHRVITQGYFVSLMGRPDYIFVSKRVAGVSPWTTRVAEMRDWHPTGK
jgi:peptide/nickel transport system substrate-binding protein